MVSEYQKGVIWVLISAFSFGFLGIFGKFAYRENINLITLLFLRFSFASIIMFLYTKFKNLDLKLAKKELASVLALGGLCYSSQAFGFFQALHYLTVGVTTLILYTYPVFVTIIAIYYLKEKITNKTVIALFSALIGVFLVVYSNGIEVNLKGVVFIMASSLIYSIYITLSKITVRNVDPRVMGVYVMFSAASTFFLIGTATGKIQINLTPKGFLISLLIALIPTIIAIVTFFEGIRLIGSSRASIISTLEPVVAATLGFLLLGEVLSPVQIFGGVMILTSVLILRKE